MAIDLHVHSTASDGQCAPAEVVRRAHAAGLVTIALTDHDTLDGVREASSEGERAGVRVIPGCEFSVSTSWGEMHLLGFFLPQGDEELTGFLKRQRENRARRAEEIVTRLDSVGVHLSTAEVMDQAGGGAVGRPHVARALVARNVVPDAQTAFDRFLGRGRPAFVPKRLSRVEEVATLVRRVGGVTCAAHLGKVGTRRKVSWLKQSGVDGVEVIHPSHDDPTTQRLSDLADQLGLTKSGGSDWHGKAEKGISRVPFGALSVPPAWLDQIEHLARVRRGDR